MGIFLSDSQTTAIFQSLDAAYAILARAQGEADRYEAKREEFKILTFPSKKDSESNTRTEANYFTQEELKSMPRLKDGHIRITKDGLWQVRYRRDGYDKQFTSKQKNKAWEKFREWCKSVKDETKANLPKKAELFADHAERFFEIVKKPNVEEVTYQSTYRLYRFNIYPRFGSLKVKQITPLQCQELLNNILHEGKGRTAEAVKFLLNEIFRSAVGERLITSNPMEFVKIPKHQRENGTALTKQEVRKFLESCKQSPYGKQFLVFLYTGIRRNELHSLQIDGNFVVVANGKKRRGQKQTYRKIPIAEGIKDILPLSEAELAVKNTVLSMNFKKLLPNHHLYDLRHTFTSRCLECGIRKEVVDVWTAHENKNDMTSSVYTHFSPEFMLEEMKKLSF